MTEVQETEGPLALQDRQVRLPDGLVNLCFPAGTMICREDEPGDRLYIVRSGLVAIKKWYQGKEHVLGYLGTNELFGEIALINGSSRMASAWAVRDTECLAMETDDFHKRLAGADPFIQDLLGVLARGLRSLTDDWMDRRNEG